MSTTLVCNTLVSGSSRSGSSVFDDLRHHYCQDSAVEISVRSTGFVNDGFPAAKNIDFLKTLRIDYLSASPALRSPYEN